MLTVLQVAYPLAPVAVDAVGGAEQILAQLDAALTARGHRSLVVACSGSRVSGTLIATGPLPAQLDDAAVAAVRARHRMTIERVLATAQVDLVHLHGIDFDRYLPSRARCLATLHLPLDWYAPAALQRGNVALVCVSRAQRMARPGLPADIVPNGVALPPPEAHARRRFVLVLARVCPEKGLHLAIDAARRARLPIVIAGRLFPYPAHVEYWQREIVPRLGPDARFIGPVAGARKQRLLAAARCLVVPSLVAETSSLVAMEALAAGTPVVARPVGALPEIIEHGRTGFLADSVADLAEGMTRAPELDGAVCRASAAARHSLASMIDGYLTRYERLARERAA